MHKSSDLLKIKRQECRRQKSEKVVGTNLKEKPGVKIVKYKEEKELHLANVKSVTERITL